MKEFNFSKFVSLVSLQQTTLPRNEFLHRYLSIVFSSVVEQLLCKTPPSGCLWDVKIPSSAVISYLSDSLLFSLKKGANDFVKKWCFSTVFSCNASMNNHNHIKNLVIEGKSKTWTASLKIYLQNTTMKL